MKLLSRRNVLILLVVILILVTYILSDVKERKNNQAQISFVATSSDTGALLDLESTVLFEGECIGQVGSKDMDGQPAKQFLIKTYKNNPIVPTRGNVTGQVVISIPDSSPASKLQKGDKGQFTAMYDLKNSWYSLIKFAKAFYD